MTIFLTTNLKINNSFVMNDYKTRVIENYLFYIKSLIDDLNNKNNKEFEVIQAKTILDDLLLNKNYNNLFLKKYFVLKEYSNMTNKNWYNIDGIKIPDLFEELDSFFNLKENTFSFLKDELYYKFSTEEFVFFLNSLKPNSFYNVNKNLFKESLNILIY